MTYVQATRKKKDNYPLILQYLFCLKKTKYAKTITEMTNFLRDLKYSLRDKLSILPTTTDDITESQIPMAQFIKEYIYILKKIKKIKSQELIIASLFPSGSRRQK